MLQRLTVANNSSVNTAPGPHTVHCMTHEIIVCMYKHGLPHIIIILLSIEQS